MNLDDLRLFHAVSVHGSFTRAARELGLPKQTVSRRVAGLERALGVELLQRTTRRVRLTPIGASYAERCREIVQLAEAANREAADPPESLRLTADEVFGEFFLAPLLIEFALRHPQLRLEAHLTTRQVDLVEEGFDLAVRVGGPTPAGAIELGPAVIRYCASPEYLERRGRPQHPQELRAHECLVSHHDQWPFREVGRVAVSGRFRCNSFRVVREACLQGLGIALFPAFACAREIAHGRLEPVLEGWVPAVGSLFVLTASERPPVRELARLLRESF